METPTYTGKHMRASRQPGRQAVDGGLFHTIHNPANTPLCIDTVKKAIFAADILSPQLVFSSHTPEMPINIIGRPEIFIHLVTLLPAAYLFTTENIESTKKNELNTLA